jgi:UrcA family protein
MNTMKSSLRSLLATLLAGGSLLACGYVIADEPANIQIEAARPTTTVRGAPDEVVSVKHQVSYADLDLATQKGDRELVKRIGDAAAAVCKRIDTIQSLQNQEDRSCVKDAVDGAMIRARAAISAASTAAAK